MRKWHLGNNHCVSKWFLQDGISSRIIYFGLGYKFWGFFIIQIWLEVTTLCISTVTSCINNTRGSCGWEGEWAANVVFYSCIKLSTYALLCLIWQSQFNLCQVVNRLPWHNLAIASQKSTLPFILGRDKETTKALIHVGVASRSVTINSIPIHTNHTDTFSICYPQCQNVQFVGQCHSDGTGPLMWPDE